MKKQAPDSPVRERLRNVKPVQEALLVQVYTDRIQATPVMWLQRIQGASLEIESGKMRRRAWMAAGRTISLELVNPLTGELLKLTAEVMDVETNRAGFSLFVLAQEMTSEMYDHIVALASGETPAKFGALRPERKAPRPRARLISEIRVRAGVRGHRQATPPALPLAATG